LLFITPTPAVTTELEEYATILDRVLSWRNAWEKKDIERYMSHYSRAFKADSLNYDGWKRKKKAFFEDPASIRVGISSLCIRREPPYHLVTFNQAYEGAPRPDFGKKILAFKKENGTWNIMRESWRAVSGIEPEAEGDKETGFLDGLIIRSMGFEKDPATTSMDRVYMKLNFFYVPDILFIAGEKPILLMEFPHVASWQGPPALSTNGRFVQKIRAYLYGACRTLRVVLDMDPKRSYNTRPLYNEEDRTFLLEITE
jgi:ketosteroid isomerase-like protein